MVDGTNIKISHCFIDFNLFFEWFIMLAVVDRTEGTYFMHVVVCSLSLIYYVKHSK